MIKNIIYFIIYYLQSIIYKFKHTNDTMKGQDHCQFS